MGRTVQHKPPSQSAWTTKKTASGDGNITLKKSKDSPLSHFGDEEITVSAARYGWPTALTGRVALKTSEIDNVEYVPTSIPDRKQGEEKSKNTESTFPERKQPRNYILMAVNGQTEYFMRTSRGAENNIMHRST